MKDWLVLILVFLNALRWSILHHCIIMNAIKEEFQKIIQALVLQLGKHKFNNFPVTCIWNLFKLLQRGISLYIFRLFFLCLVDNYEANKLSYMDHWFGTIISIFVWVSIQFGCIWHDIPVRSSCLLLSALCEWRWLISWWPRSSMFPVVPEIHPCNCWIISLLHMVDPKIPMKMNPFS